MKRFLTMLMVFLLAAPALTGCTREETLAVYNRLVEALGARAMSDDGALVGERTRDADGLGGTYRAEYEDFTGTELLFGGASVERRDVAVDCRLRADAGEAKVFWLAGDSATLLLGAGGAYRGKLTLPDGGNIIGVYCKNFSGTLDMAIE